MTAAELQVHEPYTDIKAEIAKLAEENERVVFDYEDPKGQKMARSHIYSFRQIRSSIEKRRKELKADALEYGRRVDAVAKELTSEVVKMIAVHEEPIKRIERREAERAAAIDEAIESIKSPGLDLDARSSAGYAEAIKRLEEIEIDADTYQERMAEAVKLKEEELSVLRSGHAELLRVEAERAELDRLRREKEEREREEREQRIAREAAEKAQREAEAKAKREREEAERKAAAERAEAARREREATERAERAEREAAKAAKRAERERVEAEERAERARLDAIEQAKREREQAEAEAARIAEEQRVADEKRAANKRNRAKVLREALVGLSEYHSGTQEEGKAIIQAIADGKIPHITITF